MKKHYDSYLMTRVGTAPTDSSVEKRRFPRIKVSIPVNYRPIESSSKARDRGATILTIGEGGIFLITKLTYPKETRLMVAFRLNGIAISSEVSVRYAVPFDPNIQSPQFPGMGLEYQGMPEEMKVHIRRFVAKEQLKEGLGLAAS